MVLHGDTIRLVKPQDIEEAYRLETEGYPPDEAASFDELIYRQKQAPGLFLGAFHGYDLRGFIVATRASGSHLTENSMKEHTPSGESVCIHSVCVDPLYRKMGIATQLLKEFIEHIRQTQSGVKQILLICHAELIPLYTRVGFVFVGKSPVNHGKRQWFEMEYKT